MASETGKYNCAPCNLQGNVSKIYCFCIDCIEHLCETCLEQHNKFKVTRSHRVLQGEELPENIAILKKLAEIGLCNVHQDRRIEYKCLTHQEFVCPACIKNAHRGCVKVEDIDKILVNEDAFQRDFVDGTKELILKVEQVLLNKENRLEVFERHYVDVNKQKSKFLEELKNLIAHLDHDVADALDLKTKAGKAELTAYIEECRNFKDTLIQHIELINTVLKYGSNQQRTIVKAEIEKTQSMIKNGLKIQEESDILLSSSVNILTSDEIERLGSMKTLIEETLKDETETEDKLIVDKENATVIARNDEKTTDVGDSCDAGGFSISSDEDRCESTQRQETKSRMSLAAGNSTITGACKRSFFESNVRLSANYDISHFPGVPCSHRGSVLLDDGGMVFIDSANDNIKLVTAFEFGLKTVQYLDSKPFDIARVGNSKIVVAVDKAVLIFSVDYDYFTMETEVTLQNEFLTKYTAYSVCSVSQNLALLYSRKNDNTSESSVQIRTLKNRIQSNITMFENKDGESIDLDDPCLLRSRYPGEIIITDRNELMAFDLNGKQQWDYYHKGPDIECVAFDSDSNIYFCDIKTCSIYQINAKSCEKDRILISKLGSKDPTSILINSKTREIVVGFENNNEIEVYEFC